SGPSDRPSDRWWWLRIGHPAPDPQELGEPDHPRFGRAVEAQLGPIGTSTQVLGTHFGAVRSFELSGTSTTAGRRWAARCSCGVVATTGAWPEALAYLSEHHRAAPNLRPAEWARRPAPA